MKGGTHRPSFPEYIFPLFLFMWFIIHIQKHGLSQVLKFHLLLLFLIWLFLIFLLCFSNCSHLLTFSSPSLVYNGQLTSLTARVNKVCFGNDICALVVFNFFLTVIVLKKEKKRPNKFCKLFLTW